MLLRCRVLLIVPDHRKEILAPGSIKYPGGVDREVDPFSLEELEIECLGMSSSSR